MFLILWILKRRKMAFICLLLDQERSFGVQFLLVHQRNSIQRIGNTMRSWTFMVTLLANQTMLQFMELIFQPLHLEHQRSIVIIHK